MQMQMQKQTAVGNSWDENEAEQSIGHLSLTHDGNSVPKRE